MRGLTLAFLLCWFSTIVNAQVTIKKPVYCDSAAKILETVATEYKEKPVWLGTQDRGLIMLLTNSTTKTWTLLEIYDEIACVLGTGSKFNLLSNFSESL